MLLMGVDLRGGRYSRRAGAARRLADVPLAFYQGAMTSAPLPVTATPALPAMPGQRLARGTGRLLRSLDHAVLTEFVPARGLRVDLISLGPKGELWIVECKSSRADFTSDRKWQGYLDWCDRYFWAVDGAFPVELLPEDTGLIHADAFGAEIARMAPEHRLSGPRRTKVQRDFARAAALRLQVLADPESVIAGAI